MISNQSALNISVRVTAQKAYAALEKLDLSLDKVATSGTRAGGVLDAISLASAGYTKTLGGASVEAANLAKSLALINKSGTKTAARLLEIGVGAETATPFLLSMNVASAALSKTMGPLAVQLTMAAAGLKTISKAASTSAVQTARADAIRQQSATKTAASVKAAQISEQAARDKAAAAATLAATRQEAADAKTAAASRTAAAAIEKAELGVQAAKERTAAVAAASAASQEASAARAARAAAAAAGAGAAGAGAGAAGAAAAGAGAMSRFGNTISETGSRMREFGSRSQWMGRQISMFFTLPFALAAGAAVKWYIEQDKAFRQLNKVYGNAGDAARGLNQDIEQVRVGLDMMSNYFGANREEVYEVAEAWASLGKTGGALAANVENTMNLAALGNMGYMDATTALIAVQQQFRLSTEETTTAMVKLNAISNEGPTEIGPMMEALQRVGSSAHDAGMSIEETAGIIQSLAPAAGTTTQAGNGLKSMLVSIMAPTTKADAALEHFGISTARWTAEGTSAVDRLKEMGEAYQFMNPQQKIAFNSMVAGRWQLSRFGQTIGTINDENGEFAKAMRATADTFTDAEGKILNGSSALETWNNELRVYMDADSTKFAQVWQQIKNSLTDAFKPIIPTLLMAARVVGQLFEKFSNLPEPVKKFAIYALLALAVLGPIIMVLSSLMILLGVLGPALVTIAGFFFGVGHALLYFLGIASAPGWIVALTSAFGTATTAVGVFAINMMGAFSTMWTYIGVTTLGASGTVSAMFANTWAWITLRTAAFAGWMSGMWTNMWAFINVRTGIGAALNAGIWGTFTTAVGLQWLAFSGWVSTTWGRMWSAVSVTTAAGATGNGGIMGAFFAGVAAAWGTATSFVSLRWAAMWTWVASTTALGTASTGGLLTGGLGFMAGLWMTASTAMSGIWAGMWTWINATTAAGTLASGFTLSGGAAFMYGAWLALSTTMATTWGAAWTGMVGITGGAVAAIAGILASPILPLLALVAAVVFVGSMFWKFRDTIGKAIVSAAKAVGTGVKAIVMFFVNLLKSLIDIGMRIARAINNALNPWQRHSPSVVDNVRSGTAAVEDAYANMASSVANSVGQASNSLRRFSSASAGMNANAANIDYQDKRSRIARVDPGAAAEYDGMAASQQALQRDLDRVNSAIKAQNGVIEGWQSRIDAADKQIEGMNKTLESLQKQVDATSDAMDAAQDRLDEYTNANIAGSGAMSDAIFENDMAQKKLRLEIMRMEEAGGAVDDIADKYSRLQGEIENLSGKRNELRASGAGSDILSTYDKMIADLQKQQGALASAGVSPIKKAQDELDALAKRGEMLSLEQSLKFDPMTRQIDKMTKSMKEMPFEQIVAGINKEKAALASATSAHDAAQAAYDGQKSAIDAATEARDALSDGMQVEQDKLDALNGLQTTLQEKLDEVTGAMDLALQSADTIAQKWDDDARAAEELANKAKEAKEGVDSLSDAQMKAAAMGELGTDDLTPSIPMPETGDLDQWTKDMNAKMGNAFDEINLNPFKGWGDKAKKWLFGDELSKLFTEGSGGVNWMKILFGGDGKTWNPFAGVKIREGSLFDMARDLWNGLWQGIKSVFSDPQAAIGEYIVNPIVNWVKSLFGIASPSTVFAEIGGFLMQGLLGGVQAGVGAVLMWFVNLPGNILTAIGDLAGWLAGKFQQAVDYVASLLPTWAGNILRWFASLPIGILNAIGDFASMLGGKFSGAIDRVTTNLEGWFSTGWSWVKALPGRFVNYLASLGSDVPTIFLNMLRDVGNRLEGGFSNGWNWVKALPGRFVDYLKDLPGKMVDTGINVVEGIWEGIKSKGRELKANIEKWVEEHVPWVMRKALGIASPSKVTEEMGVQTVDGLAVGINAENANLQNSLAALSAKVANTQLPPLDASKIWEDFNGQTGKAMGQIDVLTTGLTEYMDAAFASTNTQVQLNEALVKANETIAAMPTSLQNLSAALVSADGTVDVSTEAGRNLHQTMLDLSTTYGDVGNAAIQKALEEGQSHEQALTAAQNATAGIRDSLVATLEQQGVNAQSAQQLADKYLGMVREYWTSLMLNKSQAEVEFDNFVRNHNVFEVQMRVLQDPNFAAGATPQQAPIAGPMNAPIPGQWAPAARAAGGWIVGPGTGTSDSILGVDGRGIPTSRVSANEFVVNAQDAAKHAQLLELINSGRLPAFAGGGAVGASSGSAAGGAATATMTAGVMLPNPVETLPDTVQETVDTVLAIETAYLDSTVLNLAAITTMYASSYDGIHDSTILTATDLATQQRTIDGTLKTNLTGAQTAFLQQTLFADQVSRDARVAVANDLSNRTTTTNQGMVNTLTAQTTSLRDQMNNLTISMRDQVSANFSQMGTNLTGTMSSVIRPMFESFNPLLDQVTTWFGETVGNVGQQWAGIKEPVAVPARFIINEVYNNGIKTAWNKVNGFLGLQPLEDFTAKFATGGPVAEGRVRGPGTGTSDSINARLSHNEHVITAKEVKGAGGHRAVEAQRAAWKAGVPAFARGGPVDVNAAPWSGGGGESNLKPAAILARRNVHKYWPEIGTIGGYRASDPYPDHPSGLALDIMTASDTGTEIKDWLHAERNALALNYTIWRQRYQPAGGTGNMMEDRGSATQNHMDHIHALFNANGVPGIQDGGVGGGGGSAPAPSFMQLLTEAYRPVMDAVKAKIPSASGNGTVGQMAQKGYDKFDGETWKFLAAKATAMDAQTTSVSPPGEGAERWRPMSMDAMRRVGRGLLPDDTRQVNAMLSQIMSESSGDPNRAQQIVDVNGTGDAAGVGLLQIIPSTWRAHRDPALVDNRRDPFANMVGALRYYTSRYGSDLTTQWGHGHGYDNGGVLPPGITQAVNASRKPEAILTNSQWGNVSKIVAGVGTLIRTIGTSITSAFKLGFKFWIGGKPLPVKPTTPPVVVPPVVPPVPPVPPTPGFPRDTTDKFWSSASAQMKTWTADFQPAIEGLTGVVANQTRAVEGVVVPEWPEYVAPPKVVVPPIPVVEYPEYVPPVIPPIVVPPVTTPTTPTTPTAPGTGGTKGSSINNLISALFTQGQKLIPVLTGAGKNLGPVLADAVNGFLRDPLGSVNKVVTAIGNEAKTVVPALISAGKAVEPALTDVVKQYANGSTFSAQFGSSMGAATINAGTASSVQAAQVTFDRTSSGITATVNSTSGKVTASAEVSPGGDTVNINITGDLSFPNITSGQDVDKLIQGLKARAATG